MEAVESLNDGSAAPREAGRRRRRSMGAVLRQAFATWLFGDPLRGRL